MTEPNFAKGDISTKYLSQTYPQGFQGKNLSMSELAKLCAIASVIFVRDQIRSHIFLNGSSDPLVPSNAMTEWDLLVNVDDKNKETSRIPVSVKLANDKFVVTVDNETFEFPKKINLASSKLEFDMNGDKPEIVQFLSLDGAGRLQLQFMGTKVSFFPSFNNSKLIQTTLYHIVKVIYDENFPSFTFSPKFHVHVLEEYTADYYKLMPIVPQLDITKIVKSPMPGLVKSVSCEAGQMVRLPDSSQ